MYRLPPIARAALVMAASCLAMGHNDLAAQVDSPSGATAPAVAPSQNRLAKIPAAAAAKPRAHPKAQALPLPPRGAARGGDPDKAGAASALRPTSALTTGLASLAVVLSLFFLAAWAVRRGLPVSPKALPSDVVEVLGRTALANRQFAHLIRCGNKLLLVHLAPGCAETLTEITDPVEVDRLAGLCRQAHPQSATTSFRQVFQQFSREKGDGT